MNCSVYSTPLRNYLYKITKNGYKPMRTLIRHSSKITKPAVSARAGFAAGPQITQKVAVADISPIDPDSKGHHSFTKPNIGEIPVLEIDSKTIDDVQTIITIPAIRKKDGIQPSDLQIRTTKIDLSKLHTHYQSLSKSKLTSLVVCTTLGGYCLAPGIIDPTILTCALVGTALTSCAANTINQFLEVPYDSQMARTRNRVLVRKVLSPHHAMAFAALTGTLGVSVLALGTNGLTACLGLTNLLLYTCAYTPMKRLSIANTWVGSVVGAIPPVMGWTAMTGTLDPAALVLAGLLFSWQFPHFNALSWNLRPDYSRAGYRMMSVTHPDLCRKTTLRYSLALIGLCTIAPFAGLTSMEFMFSALPLNLFFAIKSFHFYQEPNTTSSKSLFRLSLIYLPFIMMLLFVYKKRPDKTPAELETKIGDLKQIN